MKIQRGTSLVAVLLASLFVVTSSFAELPKEPNVRLAPNAQKIPQANIAQRNPVKAKVRRNYCPPKCMPARNQEDIQRYAQCVQRRIKLCTK